MASGNIRQLDFHSFADPATGVRVTRLTPPDVISHRTYFYQKCFSASGRHLLFGSELDGHLNHWLLDVETGEARQITEGPGCNTHGAFLSPDDRHLYYVRDRLELRRVELASLTEEVVYRVPHGWRGMGTWVPNSACTKFAAMLQSADDIVQGSSAWERFHQQFARPPLSRLISIDATSGEGRTVLEERRYLGHPMYRPFDDSTMGFCHEGPHDLVAARMWLINEDGSALRQVKQQAPGESCMHEFWVPDGSRLIYVSYRKDQATRSIWAADPATLANELIMSMPPCSHLMSNFDGSLLVGDGAGQNQDLSDPAAHPLEPDPWLYLFDLSQRRVRRICAHNTTWGEYRGNHQTSHPHPSFTPDEQQVLFTSDMHGLPALYLADLTDLPA